MPIVERGGPREVADQWVGLLYLIVSRAWHQRDLRYGPQTAVPRLAIMLPISVSLSSTKFLPEQRVDQDRMVQSHERSSTSTKNSQKKPCTEVAGRPRLIVETPLAATRRSSFSPLGC
jgi:hypothetical protein